MERLTLLFKVFDSGSDSDRYFRLARVQIMFGSCDGFESENCTENRVSFEDDVKKKLISTNSCEFKS